MLKLGRLVDRPRPLER